MFFAPTSIAVLPRLSEAYGVDAEEALERLEKLLAEFHEQEKT